MSLDITEKFQRLYTTGVLPVDLDVIEGYWLPWGIFNIKTLEIVQVAQAFSSKELTEEECIGKLENLLRCGASPVLESEFEKMSALHIFVIGECLPKKILKLIFENEIEYIPGNVIRDLYDDIKQFKRLISCGMSIYTPIKVNEEMISLQEYTQKLGYPDIFQYINIKLMDPQKFCLWGAV